MPLILKFTAGAILFMVVTAHAGAGAAVVVPLTAWSDPFPVRPVRRSFELLDFYVGGEKLIFISDLLQDGHGRSIVERIQRRQVHHVVKQ